MIENSTADATVIIRFSSSIAPDDDMIMTMVRHGAIITITGETEQGGPDGDEPMIEDHTACGNDGVDCLEASLLRGLQAAQVKAAFLQAVFGESLTWTVERSGVGANRDTASLIPSPVAGEPLIVMAEAPAGWAHVTA